MRTVRTVSTCCAMLLAGALAPSAAPPAHALEWQLHDDVTAELGGDYRLRGLYQADVPAYSTPSDASRQVTYGLKEGAEAEHRLRLDPKVTLFDELHLNFQMDVISGVIGSDRGDRTFLRFSKAPPPDDDAGASLSSFDFRRAWLEWEAPFGLLRFGRQPSQWGLGVLANAGDGFTQPFGDAYLGDTYDRLLVGTKPVSLVRGLLGDPDLDPENDPVMFAFAFDFGVEQDALSKEGDDLLQYIMALVFERGENDVGVYAVRREQEHDDSLRPPSARPNPGFLDAWIFDTSGTLVLPEGTLVDGLAFELAWELAYAIGETNFVVSPAFQDPDDPFPVSDVEQYGGVVRLSGRWAGGTLRLEGGYASGDSDRLDREVTDFRLHPDYNVGFILFEDLLASITAAGSYNLVDQLGEGGPVPFLGADFLASDGGVTNAMYVFPTLWLDPTPDLELRFGVLWARAVEDLVDPFNDAVLGSGGAGEVNFYGGDASKRDLGWELDLGIHYTVSRDLGAFEGDTLSSEGATFRIGLEYGHLFPGNAFEDDRGRRIDDIDKVRALATWVW